jgi:hypothetical protein
VHRFGLQRRVAVLLGEITVQRLGGGMQQVAVETADRSVGEDVLVHDVVAPACVAAVEKPQVPVGITFAVRQPAAEKPVAARHRVSVVARLAQRIAYRALELGRDALVGIEAEDPVVRGLGDREVLLPPESEPGLCDYARTGAPGEFYGIIAAAGIDDDRLGGERGGGQTIGELRSGVVRDDDQRKGESGRRIGHRVGRAARGENSCSGAAQKNAPPILRAKCPASHLPR